MITIYGHSRCGWCTKAKKLAESYNLEYNYKDTDIQENLNDLKKDLWEK
jgi:glutaredoxin